MADTTENWTVQHAGGFGGLTGLFQRRQMIIDIWFGKITDSPGLRGLSCGYGNRTRAALWL